MLKKKDRQNEVGSGLFLTLGVIGKMGTMGFQKEAFHTHQGAIRKEESC